MSVTLQKKKKREIERGNRDKKHTVNCVVIREERKRRAESALKNTLTVIRLGIYNESRKSQIGKRCDKNSKCH